MRIQMLIELHGAIFSVLTALILFTEYRKKNGKFLAAALLLNAFILICDMIAIRYDGNPSDMGRVIVNVFNFGLYALEYLQVLTLAHYIKETLIEQGIEEEHRWINIVYILLGIATIGLILTPFTGFYYYFDETNTYIRGNYFLFSMPLGAIALLVGVWKTFTVRKLIEPMIFLSLVSIFFFPIIGLIIQMVVYGISLMNLGTTLSVIYLFATYEYRRRKKRREQEIIIAQSRAYLLNSQIRPHFLFNSLAVIQSLVDEDPELVREAISHLSQYLRKTLNLRVNESTVSLKEELDYVKDYMYMEQLRFGDKVSVLYDVPPELKFRVPFLSIQPLVENAVRHGIRKKMEPGTVKIRVRESDLWYSIYIIDDGVGFDMNDVASRKPKHEEGDSGIGMKNVEERIRLMCNGTVTTESTPGVGTTVTIRIPKNK